MSKRPVLAMSVVVINLMNRRRSALDLSLVPLRLPGALLLRGLLVGLFPELVFAGFLRHLNLGEALFLGHLLLEDPIRFLLTLEDELAEDGSGPAALLVNPQALGLDAPLDPLVARIPFLADFLRQGKQRLNESSVRPRLLFAVVLALR